MLNMLIALISESHEDVMKLEHQAAVYEKLQLIIDISQSSLRYFKRSLDEKDNNETEEHQYISILKNQKSIIVTEVEMGDKIDEMRDEIKEISKTIKEVQTSFQTFIESTTSSH